MSFQVKLNSVNISARIVSGPTIHKNDVLHGKISPNECSFDIDNTNLAYTVSNLDIEGQLVEVWVNSIKQFTGYAEKPILTRNGRRVTIKAFDKMKQLQKLKCTDKMFIGSTADAILTWLVGTCGGIGSGSRNLDSIVVASGVGTTQAVVGYALYSIKDKLTDRLQEIVDSCGGSMWFDESGVLQFRAGFAASWSTSTVGTITVSKLKDIDSLQWLPSEGDRVIVKSKNRSVKTKKEPIFTWAGTVPPEGLPTGKDENGNPITDDQWRAKFDSPAIEVDDYATVNAAKEFDSGLALNETVYNSNFAAGVLKYPDFMYLQIDNSSGVGKNVTKLVIQGKPVVENYLEVIYDAGSFDVEREVSNDLISSKVWASSLAKWLYENGNDKFEVVVPLADFSLGLGWKVGNKVNIVDASTGLSHRAWVREIDIDYRNRNMTVTLRSDRASAFSYSAPPGSTTGPGTNIPYDPQFGDGSAPATPTWASTPLATFFIGGKTYIQVDWEANSESDLKGYEVAWSYDGSNWYNSGLTSETSLVIEVRAGVTVYAKVRAKDIEGFESSWTSSQNITSAKDTTIPDNLSSISAAGGYDLIYVSWVHTKPSDFSHYIVQRAPSPYSSWTEVAIVQSKEFIDKSAAAGTYYKYRVKAVDIYGNEAAAWATTTTGVTCTSISSELSDLDGELSGLAGELSTLKSELENLQFADIGGTITEVQIGNDTISAPKLKANSVETAKINAGAVTTEKLYAAAVTAEKIAAGAVTTEKLYAAAVTALKIAADAVEANHIKAGAITANKLEATLDLSVGRIIKVGDYVQIGKGVGPTGKTGDGIYVSENGYFRINSGLFMDEGLWMGKSLGERIHPFMTSNTTPSGYVVSNNKGGSNAWYLFRESTSSVINHYVNNWSQIKLPIRKTLASYNIYSASSSNCATGWVIQGSNDGTNWTDLDTQSGVSAWTGWKATDFSVSSSGAYLYYRLKILAVTGSYAMITSIKLFDAAGWKLSVVGEGADPNYLAWNGEKLSIKGDIVLGYGDNYIKFVDADITIKDGDTSSGTGYLYFERDSDTFAKLYSSATDSRFRMDVEENYVSLGVAYSDSTDSNNSVSLAFQVKSTSKTNAFAGSMSLVRLGSSTEYGYFRFTAPLNILYDTGQDAADMPQGTILIQGNDLFFRDNSGASGVWKKVSASLSTPS